MPNREQVIEGEIEQLVILALRELQNKPETRGGRYLFFGNNVFKAIDSLGADIINQVFDESKERYIGQAGQVEDIVDRAIVQAGTYFIPVTRMANKYLQSIAQKGRLEKMPEKFNLDIPVGEGLKTPVYRKRQ